MNAFLDEACAMIARQSKDEGVQEHLEQQGACDDVLIGWATTETKALHLGDTTSAQSHQEARKLPSLATRSVAVILLKKLLTKSVGCFNQ